MEAVTLLTEKLMAASIPIDGISEAEAGYIIHFRPEATAEQRDTAAVIVATFDPAEVNAIEQRVNDARQGLRNTIFTDLRDEIIAASTTNQIKAAMLKILRIEYRLAQVLRLVDQNDPG